MTKRTKTNVRGGRLLWTAALLAFPILTGAKGEGCVAGGRIVVGGTDNPDGGVSCSPADCEGKPILSIAADCPNGMTLRTVCSVADDGTCDWTYPCVPENNGVASSPIQCSLDECTGKARPLLMRTCADGSSVGATICTKKDAANECQWDFPPCPQGPSEPCAESECEGNPGLTIGCVNGRAQNVCSRIAGGSCSWHVTCVSEPPSTPVECTPKDCEGKPVPAIGCASGQGKNVCTRSVDGSCNWDMVCEKPSQQSCTPKDCKDADRLDDARTCPDGTSIGRDACTRDAATGLCSWTFPECQTKPVTCTSKDCEGKPADADARLCPDGTALSRSICGWVSGTNSCEWVFPECQVPAQTVDPSDQACSADADCELVPLKCSCDCGAPVNKDHAPKYLEAKKKMCENYVGPVCDMYCENRVECRDGLCVVP